MTHVRSLSLAGCLLASFFAMGCANTQREVPQQATSQLLEIRDQLTDGKADIQKVCDASRDLLDRPRADLTPQIERVSRELAALRATATKTRTASASADAEAQAYFTNWEAQIKTMSSDVAHKAADRQEAAKASYARLQDKVTELKPEFRSFMDSMTEAEKYLKTDGTTAGLKVIQPKIESALRKEKGLQRMIDELVAEIDRIRAGK